MTRRVVIAGAGGRDFHDFNVVFRDDPDSDVVAFTATQIPGIDDRMYPPSLSGRRYPHGIPIRPESELPQLIAQYDVDEVVFAYSDVSHEHVMHLASTVLAAGADFRLLSPRRTMLDSPVPVVAVVATRTGAGKSPTSRKVAALLKEAGLRVSLVRHPMPYGELAAMSVQRFASMAEIDAANPTIEEREEYEEPVRQGIVVYAGVDYAAILDAAAAGSDVIVWDGGNNDTAFFRPDLTICVTDPLRPGDGPRFHPGETNLSMADVVLVNKVDSAARDALAAVLSDIEAANPDAVVVLDDGPELAGRRVLVVEDGPTITHGGMGYGAGTVAALAHRAGSLVDPRPWAVGTIADTLAAHPHIRAALPAMGYGPAQIEELGETVRAVECDVVVLGTPIDLTRLVDLGHPSRHARYSVVEHGRPDLGDVLAPHVERWTREKRP